MADTTFLQAVEIEKQFSGVSVLKKVNLDVRRGEVHALMGENGAGKSTLIKIITGVYPKDGGQIYIDGSPIEINTRQDARKYGIAVIYQELSLLPALTVLENIYLGQEISKRLILDRKTMRAKVGELIGKYNFPFSPEDLVESLGVAKRQMVEILKALSMDARLVIMDEPTSALANAEAETLFTAINNLRDQGVSILYISHRIEEIYRLSDRLTVMRDGSNVGVLKKEEIVPETVMKLMIGHEINVDERHASKKRFEEHCLEVSGLAYKKLLKNVSFKAYGGEILGIGGLVGSGRTELIKCVYGAEKPSAGTIKLNGKPISSSIGRNIKNGFGLVPEDRKIEGIIPMLSIEQNLAIASYDKLALFGIVKRKDEIEYVENGIVKYDIRPPKRKMLISNLSGGNQQKIIVARWLSRDLKVLLLDEPTVGIDIGVKAEMYKLMRNLADDGAIVIMVSSDLAELANVSDRILVMHSGRFFEEFNQADVTQADILLAASGVHTERGHSCD